MQQLVVVVEGVSLWIDRGTFWDVLFPKAAGAGEQHIPRLSICAGNASLFKKIDLIDRTLDLLHVAPGDAAKQQPSWMIPVRSNSHPAPARGINAETSDDVFASLRLPKAPLAPVGVAPLGPVSYDGNPTLSLDYGSRCSLTTSDRTPFAVLRDRRTLDEICRPPLDGKGVPVTLTIQNRTLAEHLDPNGQGKSKSGDTLREVDDVHRILGIQGVALPVYDPHNASVQLASALRIGGFDPDKLCPSCYLL